MTTSPPTIGRPPAGVPAGDYTFRVRIKDPLSAEATETAQTVHVN